MKRNYVLLAFVLSMLNFQWLFSQNIWYVSESGTGNGTSWALSSSDLQTVINNAASGDQVWIKQGTYQRASGLTFAVKDGVSVYGGFPNVANPAQNQRNPRLYETILKGNQARVLQAYGGIYPISPATIIDGLTIRDGYDTAGAGLHISTCDATFRNLKIINNTSSMGLGAGMSISNSNSTFIQVLVTGNTSLLTPGSDGDTAGIRIGGGGETKFYNCVVANNHANGYVGGIWLANTSCYFYNSIIYGNTANLHSEFDTGDNYRASNGVNFYASNCILQGCRGSDYFYEAPQYAIYGTDLGGNFDTNPMFNPDYSLQANSVGINKGNTRAYQLAVNNANTDFFNDSRIVDAIDIGLSEYQTPQSEILYVKQNGTGNGSSWANASGDLQLMMDKQFKGKSVWVAEGTYYAPELYFKLRDSIKIYGGFPAVGNPVFADRNAALHPTVLTSEHVAIIGNFHPASKKISPETLVDGFVITKNENSPGLMYGIFESNSEVSYSNVTFTGLNYGAVEIRRASANSFVDCAFKDNYSLDENSHTIMLFDGAHASFRGCSFTGNYAFFGSAMRVMHNSNVLIEDCLFENNNRNVPTGIGKVIVIEHSSGTISNSVFDSNGYAQADGGIVLVFGTPDIEMPSQTHPVTVKIDRCTFKNNLNTALDIQGKVADKVSVSNSLFYKNTSSVGAGLRKSLGGDLYITNCTFTENHAFLQWGGGLFFSEGNGTNYIRNSIICNNTSVYPYAPELWAFQNVSFKNSLIRTSGGSANWQAGIFNNFDMAPQSIDLGGNLDANPLFADAATQDYRLLGQSPSVNAGSSVFYNSGATPDLSMLTSDLAGNDRIMGSAVDMGAFEFDPNLQAASFELADGMSIYPNPAQDVVFIRSADSTVKEVKIYSALGKELMAVRSAAIDLSGLSAGVYFVRAVLSNEKVCVGKIVKK